MPRDLVGPQARPYYAQGLTNLESSSDVGAYIFSLLKVLRLVFLMRHFAELASAVQTNFLSFPLYITDVFWCESGCMGCQGHVF